MMTMQTKIMFALVAVLAVATVGVLTSYTPHANAQCGIATGSAGSVNQCTGAITTSHGSITGCVGGMRTITVPGHLPISQAC